MTFCGVIKFCTVIAGSIDKESSSTEFDISICHSTDPCKSVTNVQKARTKSLLTLGLCPISIGVVDFSKNKYQLYFSQFAGNTQQFTTLTEYLFHDRVYEAVDGSDRGDINRKPMHVGRNVSVNYNINKFSKS